MKSLILLGLLLSVVLPPPCATVDVTLGQDPVQQGQTQTVESAVTNCDNKKARFGVTVTVTDAVGSTVFLRNDQVNFDAGQTIVFQDTYMVGASAPLGTYRVITIVFHNPPGSQQAVELARDTVEFQVTN